MKHLLLPAATLAGVFAAVDSPTRFKAAIARRDLVPWGGYALLHKTCPSATSACGATNCCPDSYTCKGATYDVNRVCCPSSAQASHPRSPCFDRTKLTCRRAQAKTARPPSKPYTPARMRRGPCGATLWVAPSTFAAPAMRLAHTTLVGACSVSRRIFRCRRALYCHR